ncbi:hypothetical protein LSTR_LSTR000141 [Laodelphax striatellus]|uniref:Uncharacterized protein n=1 Tax=Laodelphax striatellus TaxID=195883 RepID=A0A482X6N1_LAOST|nr:hypothetical protein LSTR_LSTR000141 [Laodelphax striatellus]
MNVDQWFLLPCDEEMSKTKRKRTRGEENRNRKSPFLQKISCPRPPSFSSRPLLLFFYVSGTRNFVHTQKLNARVKSDGKLSREKTTSSPMQKISHFPSLRYACLSSAPQKMTSKSKHILTRVGT